MIKAVVTKGVIVLRDPLPEDWQEGTEVAIEKFANDAACDKDMHPTDAWMDEVEAIALLGNREDDKRLDAVIQEYIDVILASSGETIRLGKQAFYAQRTLTESAAYDHAVDVMTGNAIQYDAQEGIAAFLQKRPPKWQ